MSKFIKITSVLLAALPLFWSGGASAISLPGIVESGSPNFENPVAIKYQRANGQKYKLKAKSVANTITGTFNLNGSSYTVNNLKYRLRANFDKDANLIGGSVRINGQIAGLGAKGKLFKANLTGFNTDGSVIGFNTHITHCHPDIASFCTTNESVYLYDFGGGFDTSLKKFREDGMALTTIPVPAAVWLFGSGLLGLVSIARRKKAAA